MFKTDKLLIDKLSFESPFLQELFGPYFQQYHIVIQLSPSQLLQSMQHLWYHMIRLSQQLSHKRPWHVQDLLTDQLLEEKCSVEANLEGHGQDQGLVQSSLKFVGGVLFDINFIFHLNLDIGGHGCVSQQIQAIEIHFLSQVCESHYLQ